MHCSNHCTSQGFSPKYPSLYKTASTWIDHQQKNYLANVNYRLINQINDTQAEKFFYKNKVSEDSQNHHSELEQAFIIINQKNIALINLEEEVERSHKQLRSATDQLVSVKRGAQSQKQFYQNQIKNTKATCEEKIKKMESELQSKYELKLKKRTQEVQNQCEDRIKMYNSQIATLTQNSKRLTHELSLVQQDYRQMLLKNDTIIQESIHRQLRKRDFQAQNNYLHDVAQTQAIKNEKKEMQQKLNQVLSQIQFLKKDNKQLNAKIEVLKTKNEDLEQALQIQKKQNKVVLEQKYKEFQEVETNTDQQYVPIVLPIDVNLISQIVSVKQFLVEKIVERFLSFYELTATHEAKNKSKSLITFKNSLTQLKQRNPDLKILFFMHTSLQRLIKVYCPSMSVYANNQFTIKDQFIKKTLMECETIAEQKQKLFRLLDLFFRIKNPLNHLHAEITTSQLRLIQAKFLACLKKIFNS